MRALIQRVKEARVITEGSCVGEIDKGLLVFLGIREGDTIEDVDYLVNKIINLRVFSDDQGKMNFSLLDIKGKILVVPQFTLYADCSRGRRPSYSEAAKPSLANSLYEEFIKKLIAKKIDVQSGVFGAYMDVELINDGPVTIIIEN